MTILFLSNFKQDIIEKFLLNEYSDNGILSEKELKFMKYLII